MTGPAFTSSRSWWLWMGMAGTVVLLDQAVKQAIVALTSYGASYSVTPFFNLAQVWNRGAAFSFLADAGGWQRYVFTILGIGVSVALAWLLRRGVTNRLDTAAYALIMGGALGNVADRLARGAVVDYLDFHWQGWHWPAFNLADVSITAGASLLILASLQRSGSKTNQPGTSA